MIQLILQMLIRESMEKMVIMWESVIQHGKQP